MKLEDLITLSAASLLGDSIGLTYGKERDYYGRPIANGYAGPSDEKIAEAVKTAKRIWKEVLRSESDD